MAKFNKDLRSLEGNAILTLTITKEFKIRMFIAIQLIKLAALILNCGIEINDKEKTQDQ